MIAWLRGLFRRDIRWNARPPQGHIPHRPSRLYRMSKVHWDHWHPKQ